MKTLKPSEIAEYCNVHNRTISRWIAKGQLKGHKLPGRGNYRVAVSDFINFLHKQQMPVPERFLTGASDKKEKVQAKQDPDLTATTLGLDTPLLEDNMASNNWVVHGDYTESGMPLLANDPHL